jgi:Pro-kumamolisin, activation domain
MLILGFLRGRLGAAPPVFLAALSFATILPLESQTPRVVIANSALDPASDSSAVAVGALPGSQPLHLSLRLTPSADRTAALDQLLAAQIKPGSPSYHQWLRPQQFAESLPVRAAMVSIPFATLSISSHHPVTVRDLRLVA